MSVSMHPLLERSLTCSHAAEQIPKVGLRHAACIEPHLSAGRDDTIGDQVQQLASILSNQLIDAVADSLPSGWAEPAHVHLPVKMLPDPGDPTPGKPASQIVHGTADRSEAVVLHDFERIPETASKELLPTVMLEMLYQGQVLLLSPPCARTHSTHETDGVQIACRSTPAFEPLIQLPQRYLVGLPMKSLMALCI